MTSYLPKYRVGQSVSCPGCGGRHWIVGRTSAVCGRSSCGFILELAGTMSAADGELLLPAAK